MPDGYETLSMMSRSGLPAARPAFDTWSYRVRDAAAGRLLPPGPRARLRRDSAVPSITPSPRWRCTALVVRARRSKSRPGGSRAGNSEQASQVEEAVMRIRVKDHASHASESRIFHQKRLILMHMGQRPPPLTRREAGDVLHLLAWREIRIIILKRVL